MKRFIKDNLIIIIIVAVFLLIITLFSFVFINQMKLSQKDIQKQVEYIEEQYQKFSASSSEVSKQRTKIYNEVFNNVYYIDFKDKDQTWKEYFEEYYKSIDVLYNEYVDVMNVCSSYNFIYDSTKQKCDSIGKYYEILINDFSIDYNIYNDNLNKYNEWTNSNDTYSKLELYKKDNYIEMKDYNKNNEIEHY